VDGQYELLIVADINAPIRNAIQEEADFVIICLSLEAMKSGRDRRENLNGLLKKKNSL
jgi:hypothetical protein